MATQPDQSLVRRLAAPLLAALTTPHGVDRYLEQIEPTWSMTDVRARVVGVRRETADAVTLTLQPNRRWRGHAAGPWVCVSVDVDGVRRTRCYSISSPPTRADGLIEITVQRQPGGLVSNALAGAREGRVLGLSQAGGEFVLPAARPARVLLVSGGSGVTPCMSILRTLVAERHDGRVTVLHYARTGEDVIFDAELRALAAAHPRVDVHVLHTRGPAPCARFSRATLDALVPDAAACETYVCGPPSLVDAVAALWIADGRADRLHVERFVAPVAPLAADGGGELTFARRALTVAAGGGTLLEQAERAGLRPDSGCRMGICMTCKCKKIAGTVRDLRTGELSDTPDESGRFARAPAFG
jgi:ferredoxin-NADP reductase